MLLNSEQPRGRAVSAHDFGSRGLGFESRWKRDSFRTALHCAEPFMFTLPSSWNTVEKDAKTAAHPSIHLKSRDGYEHSWVGARQNQHNDMCTCATSELYYQPWHPRSLVHRSLVTHKAHSDDSDQTGRMLRLILFLSGCTDHLVDLSRSTTKPTKWHVRPANTRINLGIRPVWSQSLYFAINA